MDLTQGWEEPENPKELLELILGLIRINKMIYITDWFSKTKTNRFFYARISL